MRDATKQAERLAAIRLRYRINSHLDDPGIAAPVAEAARLLRHKQWRAIPG